MSSPRTSIIMPVYNTADTVVVAMESVLAQTDPDFELLVVVDGSPDHSSKVIREFLQNTPDPRIRLFDNEQNAGVSAARNQGLDEARGEWITFIDSDDTYRPLRHVAAQMWQPAVTLLPVPTVPRWTARRVHPARTRVAILPSTIC